MLNKSSKYILLLTAFLTACQPANLVTVNNTPVKQNNPVTTNNSHSSVNQTEKKVISPVLVNKPELYGTITSEKALATSQQKNLSISISYDLLKKGFTTKAIDCSEIAKIKVSINGINMTAPIYADGSDSTTNTLATSGCDINANISNVPYGRARVATVQAYDSTDNAIPGATIKTVFDVSADPTNVEISYRTSTLAEIMEDIIYNSDITKKVLVNTISLSDLLAKTDAITGLSGTYPNYTYTTHPGLVNTSAISADLIAENGDVSTIDATDSSYKITPTTVTGNIKGLVGDDTVSIRVSDASSAILTNKANGTFTINKVIPGNWDTKITVESGSGTTYTVTSPIATNANSNVDLGDITLTPALPSITSVSPTSGKKDDEITITGTNFHSDIAGNVVKFGTTTATVTSASNTELKVKVPDGIFGDMKITVGVGTQTSNQADFDVTPNIITSTANGNIGDEITITGTGFSTTTTDNTVTIGGESATVNTADNNQLKVNVPAGIYGNVNITVKVGAQTSNTKTFDVTPELTSLSGSDLNVGDSLTITGTGFDSSDKDNNTVKFGSTNATVTSVNAEGTELVVTTPSSANSTVTVKTGNQTSNGLSYYILPQVSITAPANNATINGTTTLTASVTSPNTISKVEFFQGSSTLLGTATTSPYSYSWDTTALTDGVKSITAKVTDSAGKTKTSSAINVTVDNPPSVTGITASDNPVSGLGYPIQLTANATDGGTLTYTWSTLNGTFGTFYNQSGNKIMWRAPSTSGGPYTIQVSVSDGVNTAVTKTLSVSVNNGTAQVNVTGGSH